MKAVLNTATAPNNDYGKPPATAALPPESDSSGDKTVVSACLLAAPPCGAVLVSQHVAYLRIFDIPHRKAALGYLTKPKVRPQGNLVNRVTNYEVPTVSCTYTWGFFVAGRTAAQPRTPGPHPPILVTKRAATCRSKTRNHPESSCSLRPLYHQ